MCSRSERTSHSYWLGAFGQTLATQPMTRYAFFFDIFAAFGSQSQVVARRAIARQGVGLVGCGDCLAWGMPWCSILTHRVLVRHRVLDSAPCRGLAGLHVGLFRGCGNDIGQTVRANPPNCATHCHLDYGPRQVISWDWVPCRRVGNHTTGKHVSASDSLNWCILAGLLAW